MPDAIAATADQSRQVYDQAWIPITQPGKHLILGNPAAKPQIDVVLAVEVEQYADLTRLVAGTSSGSLPGRTHAVRDDDSVLLLFFVEIVLLLW